MFSVMNSSRRFVRSSDALLADLATDDIAEQFPSLALEFPELHLLDRGEVSRAGVDRDAGQEPFQLQTLDARRLLHDIRAGKIVAACLQYMDHGLRDGVTGQHGLVLTVPFWIEFRQKFVKVLDAGIIFPLWISRILAGSRRDDALCIFKTRWPHDGAGRCTDTVEQE